jgi:hypothetical protein
MLLPLHRTEWSAQRPKEKPKAAPFFPPRREYAAQTGGWSQVVSLRRLDRGDIGCPRLVPDRPRLLNKGLKATKRRRINPY